MTRWGRMEKILVGNQLSVIYCVCQRLQILRQQTSRNKSSLVSGHGLAFYRHLCAKLRAKNPTQKLRLPLAVTASRENSVFFPRRWVFRTRMYRLDGDIRVSSHISIPLPPPPPQLRYLIAQPIQSLWMNPSPIFLDIKLNAKKVVHFFPSV